MAAHGRAPCLIGVAQLTVPPGQGPAPEPLELWAEVVRRAADDAGAALGPSRLLDAVGSLDVLYCQSWSYDDPPGRLAGALGITPARQAYSGIGGTTPWLLVADAAGRVARGDLDVAVVVGAEALYTRRQLRRAGEKPAWSHRDPERKPFPFEAPFHPAEVAHEVFQAWLTFATFDIARRAHLGVSPANYRRQAGTMLAPMTEVAAANPNAWFPQARDADELITPTASNRMVGYPYTKSMVAVMDVDMAAAVVLAAAEAADALGVPEDRRIYLHSGAYAEDPVYVAEHPHLWESPALARAARRALAGAGITLDEVAHLDLYSCFAASLNFALDALGLSADDGRGLTVTGGLPFAGGPGSGYLLHSLAAMTEVLRRDPGSTGLVSGVGMHMTKHAFGVLSTRPPSPEAMAAWAGRREEMTGVEEAADPPARPIVQPYAGPATVAAYSVVHGPSGEREWGLAVCDLADEARAYARFDDADLLAEVEEVEWVGSPVVLEVGETGRNRLRAVQVGS